MDYLIKDPADCNLLADDAATQPSGKSTPISPCGSLHLENANVVKLELECAELEIEAAAAMKRAANAKREAINALRCAGVVAGADEGQLDEAVRTRLPLLESKTKEERIKHDATDLSFRDCKAEDISGISQLLSRLELPKCEIPYFDGSPLQYILFFRQFEEQVETRISDDSRRLTYLYHYCQGKAKDVIKGCLLYPSNQGYKRARNILKELFGQRHLIVRAMLDDVVSPGLVPSDADALSSYANKLVSCADALEQLGYVADLNSVSTIEQVLYKLPKFMSVEWVKRAEEIYQCDREPIFRDLCEFVCSKARLQRNRYSHLLRDRKPSPGNTTAPAISYKRAFVLSVDDKLCYKCQGKHALSDCKEFLALDVRGRWDLISKSKLCFVCLDSGHRANSCQRQRECGEKGCSRQHHQLLHQPDNVLRVNNASMRSECNSYGVSLGIIPVIVEGPKGSLLVNALLDSGADTSLVRSDLIEQLGVEGGQEMVNLNTPIGSVNRRCGRVSFRIKSLNGAEIIDVKSAYTVPSVLDVDVTLPSNQTLSKWSHLDGINFVPLLNSVVSVLLGLDTPEVHWILDQRRGKKGEPYADHTPSGWVLRGPLDRVNQARARIFTVHVGTQEIEDNLRKFYDQEILDYGSFGTAPSTEDEQAIDKAERSLRVDNGHICVGLPWKDDGLKGRSNKAAAMHRLSLLGKRLQRDEDLRDKYSAVIERYVQKGYAVKARDESTDSSRVRWYLPHHAVLNPKKPGKVRVVFDCAAICDGESLNGHLLQGPNLIPNLVGILIRFRQRPVALAADIEDMFLQVQVPEVDQSALRFLWWSKVDSKPVPEEFQLTVHPFGAVSSPFCASFALKKTAALFGHQYPVVVSQAVLENFYVDDCLISLNTESEALSLVDGLSRLLGEGGFRLTKWLSNKRGVLESIPETDRDTTVKSLITGTLPSQRTLGLIWDMQSDTFRYKLETNDPPANRRILLSRLAAIYDPLGWISPYVLPMKQLFQELCKLGIGWDERLDTLMSDKWQNCGRILKSIERVRIPRWYAQGVSDTESDIELHLFCDASEVGYGAVAYLRFVGQRIKSECAMVMAKSRVAPLKSVTIPRLELMAAVVAVALSKVIMREIKIPLKEIVYWTDSAVVLYYIKDVKSRFSTFVANRVAQIREGSKPEQWRHVAGICNPADLASRGMRLQDSDVQLWFKGPTFLEASGRVEPDRADFNVHSVEALEFKSVARINTAVQGFCSRYMERFSSWYSLLKSVAWILRFKQYLLVLVRARPDMTVHVGALTVRDLRQSCHEVIKVVQLESFRAELEIHGDNSGTSKDKGFRSSLRKLNPIVIDELLCVGGRLHWASLSEVAKHPIILPARHIVTELIIRYYHELEGHVGYTQVLATIRKKFWIINGKAAVRRITGKCLLCQKESARPCCQQMAPLPKERACCTGQAFSHVGVDYFGPIYVKRGRAEEKRYGCLFTCLNIRAIHVEVTHSLSTDSFIQALIRFMARRGQPKVIFSDNGSNFKGANSELRACVRELSQSKINQFLVEHEVEWKFGPPEASHWGGIWERMIRSVRRILRAISHGQRMTDETLLTFLTEVERIINDRPLVSLTEDAKDLEVLTPSKLLLLRDNETIMDHVSFHRSCVKLWRRVQVLADTFWKRWKGEYLSSLQERQKWFVRTNSLKPNDLVLVTDQGTHRNQWPLGIIVEVVRGTDGLVREVLVRTSHGTLRRDVRKLCLLEGDGG